MFPIVVVDVGMPEAPAEQEQALIDACTRALRQGRCVVADAARLEPAEPRAVAIVAWEEEQQRARVEVGVRYTRDKEQWLSRQLRFDPIDAPIERWRSVGLTIASLVGDLPRTDLSKQPTPPPVEPTPPPAPPHVPKGVSSADGKPQGSEDRARLAARAVRPLFAELGLSGGPGLVDGPYRAGGYARVGYVFDSTPLTVALGGRLTVRPTESRDLRVRWIDLSAQLGAYAELWGAQLEARGVLLLQEIRGTAPAPDTDSEDSQARWLPGFGLRADGVWPARGFWALVLGAEGRLMADRTAILNAGKHVAETSVFDGFLEVGVRLRW
jgi:hypothetical protein